MFRSEMQQKLYQIFGLRKTTYDAPAVNSTTGTFEQDTLFIQIDECHSRVTQGNTFARVLGSLIVYSQIEKLPYGYFQKRIQQQAIIAKDFFFFDIDLNPANSPARYQNILERRVRFVYLYSGQYDPEHGEITSLSIEG